MKISNKLLVLLPLILLTLSIGKAFSQCNPDTIPPSITCPTDQSINASFSVCTFSIGTVPPAAYSDNCSPVTLTWKITGPTSNTGTGFVCCTPVFSGINPTTYYATDTSGNLDSCTFNIIVIDAQNPGVTCPGNTAISTTPTACSAPVFGIQANAFDNCTIDSIHWTANGATNMTGTGDASGTVFNIGSTTLTYQVFDPFGNTASCSFSIQITDNSAPVLTCPAPMTVGAGSQNCDALVNSIELVGAVENCSFVEDTTWQVTGALNANGTGNATGLTFPLGQSTVTYSCTDSLSNLGSCSFTVTVVDTTAPALVCPQNQLVIVDSVCSPVISGISSTSSDNCSLGATSWTKSGATLDSGTGDASGTLFNLGTTQLTYSVQDNAGNTTTCSLTVTLQDTTRPTLSCPQSQDHYTDSTTCIMLLLSLPPALAFDHCGVPALDWTLAGSTPDSGSGVISNQILSTGLHTFTYTASDGSGNTSSCSFTVTVMDTLAPIANCQDIFAYLDSSGNFILAPNDIDNGTTDACGIQMLAITDSLFTCADTGTNTVTLTAVDIHSNQSSCSATVTVLDTVSPQPTILTSSGAFCASPQGNSYQWYLNGNPISGAIDSCFSPVLDGSYHVEVNYLTGCLQESASIMFTGQFDPLEPILNIYPNPVQDYLIIDPQSPIPLPVKIRILDPLGQEQWGLEFTRLEREMMVDMGSLSSGIYFLIIEGQGLRRINKRIIKN